MYIYVNWSGSGSLKTSLKKEKVMDEIAIKNEINAIKNQIKELKNKLEYMEGLLVSARSIPTVDSREYDSRELMVKLACSTYNE